MLSTPRLQLRLLGPDQAGEATAYLARNREHFSSAGPRVDDEYFTEEYQRRRLTRELEMASEGSLLRLWLYRDDAEGPIGDISLSHIIRGILHSCFVGYKLDRDHVGHGYMTEALERTVRYAFARLRLHRLEANIMPANVASQRVIERVGFLREGYSPKYLMINGRWEDHIRYARVNESWSDDAPAAH
jgi:ribosomal-protein-alanine N-acetyltransferase